MTNTARPHRGGAPRLEHKIKSTSTGEIPEDPDVIREQSAALHTDFSISTHADLADAYREAHTPYHRLTVVQGINRFLRRLQELATEDHINRAATVFDRCISFETDQQRVNWAHAFADIWQSASISHFLRARATNPDGTRVFTRIGVFKTPLFNWPTDKQWKVKEWHMWAAALVRTNKPGWILMLYDCDSKNKDYEYSTGRPDKLLSAPQRSLLKRAKERLRLLEVWMGSVSDDFSTSAHQYIHQDGEYVDGRCCGNTLFWAHQLAAKQDREFAIDDGRWFGFKRLDRISQSYCS